MVRSADLAGTFRGDADAPKADIFATRARERGPETQPANPFTETASVNERLLHLNPIARHGQGAATDRGVL